MKKHHVVIALAFVFGASIACSADVEDEETAEATESVKKNDRHCHSRERSAKEDADNEKRMKNAREGSGHVSVFVHVITTSRKMFDVSDQRIANQIAVLNRSFGGTGFGFELAAIDRTANDLWAQQTEKYEGAMKRALHRGNHSDLNIYIAQGFDYLGWAYLPEDLGKDSKLDGIVIQPTTLPGGLAPFDLGLTAVHEVGHWLGLEHTFKGGCHGNNGDFVDDTPTEKGPAEGCPEGRNSCNGKGDKGKDPIHNFMDYSDDRCLTEFTQGQARRMRKMWSEYRAR